MTSLAERLRVHEHHVDSRLEPVWDAITEVVEQAQLRVVKGRNYHASLMDALETLTRRMDEENL